MDLDLTDEQRAVREMARKFADEYIIPVARDNDINERFPGDIIERMGDLGLLGGPIPVEYGGAGLDYISHALVTEEVGKACSSVRTTISVQISLVELSLASWGTEEQKRRYLPAMCGGKLIGCFGLTEPNAGSDPSGMETSDLDFQWRGGRSRHRLRPNRQEQRQPWHRRFSRRSRHPGVLYTRYAWQARLARLQYRRAHPRRLPHPQGSAAGQGG
jgi:hypothetical protein